MLPSSLSNYHILCLIFTILLCSSFYFLLFLSPLLLSILSFPLTFSFFSPLPFPLSPCLPSSRSLHSLFFPLSPPLSSFLFSLPIKGVGGRVAAGGGSSIGAYMRKMHALENTDKVLHEDPREALLKYAKVYVHAFIVH